MITCPLPVLLILVLVLGQDGECGGDIIIIGLVSGSDGQAVDLAVDAAAATLLDSNFNEAVILKW